MQRTQPPVLARLARLNPTSVFLATLALVLIGLFAPGVLGGAVLLALAAGLITLLATTWPARPPATRMLRLLMLTVLLTVALIKTVG